MTIYERCGWIAVCLREREGTRRGAEQGVTAFADGGSGDLVTVVF